MMMRQHLEFAKHGICRRSSSLRTGDPSYAYGMNFNPIIVSGHNDNRCVGQAIRPVTE